MEKLIIIPARMASGRLPRKPLAKLGAITTIERVWRKAQLSKLATQVIIATDHKDILNEARRFKADCVMTSEFIQSGTDRVAAVAKNYPDDSIVVNLQGDLPFVDPNVLDQLIIALETMFLSYNAATPCNVRKLSESYNDFTDHSQVKVVKDNMGNALYFSRSPIPSMDYLNANDDMFWYHHFGIYAYRNDYLQKYNNLPKTPLEKIESLEQLRLLENGMKIKVVETEYKAGFEINTYEDLEKARLAIRKGEIA